MAWIYSSHAHVAAQYFNRGIATDTAKLVEVSMEFYSVKARKMVKVDDKAGVKVKKARSNGGFTYMVQAVGKDGCKLNKIVSETAWKALKCKEGK